MNTEITANLSWQRLCLNPFTVCPDYLLHHHATKTEAGGPVAISR